MAENFDIKVDDGNSTARVKRNIDELGSSVDKADQSITKLNGSLKGVGGAFGSLKSQFSGFTGPLGTIATAIAGTLSISKVIEYADSWTKIQNALRRTNTDTAALGAATDKVFAISQKTGTSFEANAGIFTKLQQSMQALNMNTARAGPLLETIAQSVQASGVSSASASAGLMQFQQALASGVLRGEEFNSVMENVPGLAQAIAVGLNKPVGALRGMAEQGLLTSRTVIEALERVAPAVAASAARAAPTFDQALQRISNAFTRYLGQEAQGPIKLLINGLNSIANNMNIVVPIVGYFGAALAGLLLIQLATWMATTTMALVTLTAQLVIGAATAVAYGLAWVAANPILAAAAVALLAVGAAALAASGKLDEAKKFVTDLVQKYKDMTDTTKQTGTAAGTLEERLKGLTGGFGSNTKAANDNTSAINNNGSAVSNTAQAWQTGARAIVSMETPLSELTAKWEEHKRKVAEATAAYLEFGQKASAAMAEANEASRRLNENAPQYNPPPGMDTTFDAVNRSGPGGSGSSGGGSNDLKSSFGWVDANGNPTSAPSGGGSTDPAAIHQYIQNLQSAMFPGDPGYIGTMQLGLGWNGFDYSGMAGRDKFIQQFYRDHPEFVNGSGIVGGIGGGGTGWNGAAANAGTGEAAPAIGQPNTGQLSPAQAPVYMRNQVVAKPTIIIQTPDADSFRKSKRQVSQDLVRMLRRAG